MASLLEPSELLRRMRQHIEEEVQTGTLPKGSFPFLREGHATGA